jgi:hypothetical protein
LLLLRSRLVDDVWFRGNEIGEAAGGDGIELQQAFCLGDLKLGDWIDCGHHGELAVIVGALIIAEGQTGIGIQQILQRERGADASGQSCIRIREGGFRSVEEIGMRMKRGAVSAGDRRAGMPGRGNWHGSGMASHMLRLRTRLNCQQENRSGDDLNGSHIQSLHNPLDACQRIPVALAIVLLWHRFFIRRGQAERFYRRGAPIKGPDLKHRGAKNAHRGKLRSQRLGRTENSGTLGLCFPGCAGYAITFGLKVFEDESHRTA